MSNVDISKFGKFRSFIWPIHRSENKKFIPMLIMLSLICFNYNILRGIKDTMLVTAPSSGAEAIPFAKVWAMLPMAILMTFLFTKLSNKYSREKVFYILLTIFLGFFFVFTFFLYPFREALHPTGFADYLSTILPAGFKGFIALIRNWTYTAFYVMSELWSAIVMTVLFWGFANEVTSVKEAKRFYALFGVGANITGILSGQVCILLSSNIYLPFIPYGTNAWEQSVLYLNLTLIVVGVLIAAIFYRLNRTVIDGSSIPTMITKKDEPKEKMSLRKNFAFIAKSKYLSCIAVIVVTYHLAINLVEIVWKNQMKQAFPNPSDYNIYMGEVMTAMGIIATITALFISGFVIRRFTWTFNALVPPIIMLVTGVGFFSFLLFKDTAAAIAAVTFGTTPLVMSLFFGSLQNCLARASKYTLFDATKEISFIPLSAESKLKGKGAIDGVGSRFGKSGGSIMHQGLLIIFGSLTASVPYIAAIFLGIIGVWIAAVTALGKQFNSLVAHHEKLSIPDPEKPTPAAEAKASV